MEAGLLVDSCVFKEAFVQFLPVYKFSLLEEDIFQPDFQRQSLQEEVTALFLLLKYSYIPDLWLIA